MNQTPIHLLIDTNLSTFSLNIKAYTSVNITFGEKSLGSQFLPVPVETIAFDSEKIGGNLKILLTILIMLSTSIDKLELVFEF